MRHLVDCPDEDGCLCPSDEGTLQTMKYQVTADRLVPNEWRVEAINHAGDGECYTAIFSGPRARERAEEYAALKNGQAVAAGFAQAIKRGVG